MRRPLAERFWPKVDKRGPDECWPWVGSKNGAGYGHIGSGGTNGLVAKAHRISWQINKGPIPPGIKVLHRCDNPPCVNPDHLFLGTHADTMADMATKGRRKKKGGLPGELQPMSKLTKAIVIKIRKQYASGKFSQQAIAEKYGVIQPRRFTSHTQPQGVW